MGLAMTRPRLVVVAALACGGCAATSVRPPSPAALPAAGEVASRYPPGDRLFVAVFGSDRPLPRPDRCHTWATAVRLSGGAVAEELSVSWMPATLDIRPGRLRVEPGVNMSHGGALAYAAGDGQRVVGWGPYEVTPELFGRLRVQADWLAAGGTMYQSLDTLGEAGRTGAGTNCIHALCDLPGFGRCRQPLALGYGATAGGWVARRLRHGGEAVGGPEPGLRPHFGEGVRWRGGAVSRPAGRTG